MRRSREEAAETQRRIIAVASQQFKKHGIEGIGIVDLMAKAGLTHGGFYKHFDSKADLVAEVCRQATTHVAQLVAAAKAAPGEELAAIVGSYLTSSHRDDPEHGCTIAALGAEISRQDRHARDALTEAYEQLVRLVAEHLRVRSAHEARSRAIAIVAAMVGALVAARAVADRRLSEEILQSARAQIIKTFA
jgi:TetR/AcrR family transcriptional regulator, transcriptional repressor for nem operon